MIKYDRLWITMKNKGISQYKLIKYYGACMFPILFLYTKSNKKV